MSRCDEASPALASIVIVTHVAERGAASRAEFAAQTTLEPICKRRRVGSIVGQRLVRLPEQPLVLSTYRCICEIAALHQLANLIRPL